MERRTLFGYFSIAAFIAILFSPPDSKLWVYFLIVGVLFGIGWLKN